ncbi:MAG: hypothetical protein ACTSSG_10280 [Candidatus Heimdallarchaeaceae archaeon]
MTEEEKKKVFTKKAHRFGWKDLILNLLFALIMLLSFYVFIFLYQPPVEVIDWIIRLFVICVPFLFFVHRVIKEVFYYRDFIIIEGNSLKYRSTPLTLTGFRTKKGEINLREIRKYALAKIPRKFSLDLWKQKHKAMLLISLKNGKEYLIGEYFTNEDLAQVCKKIQYIYPRAKFQTNLPNEFAELIKLQKGAKKSLKKNDNEEEIEGTTFRDRR